MPEAGGSDGDFVPDPPVGHVGFDGDVRGAGFGRAGQTCPCVDNGPSVKRNQSFANANTFAPVDGYLGASYVAMKGNSSLYKF